MVAGVTSRQRSSWTGLTSSLWPASPGLLILDVAQVSTIFWPEGHSEAVLDSSKTKARYKSYVSPCLVLWRGLEQVECPLLEGEHSKLRRVSFVSKIPESCDLEAFVGWPLDGC